MANNKEHYHNKGQADSEDKDYSRPHGIADDLTTWSNSGMAKNREENRAYDDGYFHGRGQHDANDGRYTPPRDADDREAYDAGYDGAKEDKGGGGCFLTDACVAYAGLPDDCHELTVLRQFREASLRQTPEGRALLAEYQTVAPRIVADLQAHPSRGPLLETSLTKIRRAVAYIEAGENASAIRVYVELVRELTEAVAVRHAVNRTA